MRQCIKQRVSTRKTPENDIEIKGDFPVVQSKIPLELLDREYLILQYKIAVISGLAADGILSLTNKRILIKKRQLWKSVFKNGRFINRRIKTSVKFVPEIKLSNILSIQATKIRGSKSDAEVTTKDGYTHRYIFQSLKIGSKEPVYIRDSFVSLIQSAISR